MNRPDLATRIKDYLEYQQEIFGAVGLHELENRPRILVSEAPEATQSLPEAPRTLDAAKSLEELRQICEASNILKTDLPNARLVFGTGNDHATLMLIGEAPGETEDQLGEPFVGEAGQFLNKMLAAIQVTRESIYIANVGKRRPKDNRTPTKEECAAWRPFLEKQIELVQPSMILCLGGVAAKTVLQTDASVGSLRGRFFVHERTKAEVLVTYHPSYLLREPAQKRAAWEDLQLLQKRYRERGLTPEL